MSYTGLCQVCEAAPARFTCDGCGSQVCADHYDTASGLCAACAERHGRRGSR